jgi:hypothetical protein
VADRIRIVVDIVGRDRVVAWSDQCRPAIGVAVDQVAAP